MNYLGGTQSLPLHVELQGVCSGGGAAKAVR